MLEEAHIGRFINHTIVLGRFARLLDFEHGLSFVRRDGRLQRKS
jgi:hypothetical protein